MANDLQEKIIKKIFAITSNGILNEYIILNCNCDRSGRAAKLNDRIQHHQSMRSNKLQLKIVRVD